MFDVVRVQQVRLLLPSPNSMRDIDWCWQSSGFNVSIAQPIKKTTVLLLLSIVPFVKFV